MGVSNAYGSYGSYGSSLGIPKFFADEAGGLFVFREDAVVFVDGDHLFKVSRKRKGVVLVRA